MAEKFTTEQSQAMIAWMNEHENVSFTAAAQHFAGQFGVEISGKEIQSIFMDSTFPQYQRK